ncbi:MAG: DUF4835 family protein [Runella sp.]
MKKYVFFYCGLIMLSMANKAMAQELNCKVSLNYNQLFSGQNTDNANLEQLKSVISDFINARRWTNDNFSPEERINCSLNINLLRSPAQGVYEGTAQLIITRPVFGTSYETVLLNYVDRAFNFNYLPNNPMYFNENTYTDELTHTLAFYAYIILALDYDSFSKYGGNPYIQKAFQLANMAQNAQNSSGSWRSGGDVRNRFWLIDNLMNQQMLPFRESLYTYHRLALDTFTENPIEARRQILNAINTIQQVSKIMPTSVLINSFFDAKGEEIYRIMREANKEDKQKTYTLLSQLDPAKTEMYRRLLQ